ncbi:transposase [Candidatus Nitrosoglobus terrae]|uniref:Transposase n=1 Tax=Candidatus Nitrosoglobus terrae TaxID=1630141 RepID=A0A1Q2SPM6_9GAMM|nr:transposase [Candidatus Nitrosoglobus terrae]
MRGIMANGKLARAVGDCDWSELRCQLTYKAQWYGRQLMTIGRFERSIGICPDCGSIGEKLLVNVREWECKECHAHHDRDSAAAKVILQKALTCLSACRQDRSGRQDTVRRTGIKACGLADKPEACLV